MRLEQLQYLEAVTRHGSLRRAGEELHVSQPALSEALNRLERELGVTLLDRRRSGSRISPQGRELLPAMNEVLEAVGRLRAAAGDPELAARALRVGTVNAGTSSVLVPALHDFRTRHPGTTVELLDLRPEEVRQGLGEGRLDLGLVNVLPGDDVPPDLEATELVTGHPVVCCPSDHPFAGLDAVEVDDLLHEPFVAMRAGHLMHRYAHRLFAGRAPRTSYATDGAETGKLLVAQGLGVTLLPDYSIDGDPLVRCGLITHRPLVGAETTVSLLALHRRTDRPPAAVAGLLDALLGRAGELASGDG